MRDHVRFLLNGHEQKVGGAQAFQSLSSWLRQDLGKTGTKIVCEEGDCGACSVLLRRSPDEPFRPVNSCILSLCQLDGASVVTIEGIRTNGRLHPVQEAMIACHGAQCGYCTPGFIVAMTALVENVTPLDEAGVRHGLTGNLCRCTGYEPIIKAALAAGGTSAPKMRDVYPVVPAAADPVAIEHDGRRFFAPATLPDAIAFKAANPGCTIVQGATDVGVWINKRGFTAPALLSLVKIRELGAISREDDAFVVGANATLAAVEDAVRDAIPELHRILTLFGSPQIRNAGTLVGNIANGSPIGDTLPFLLVAEAELTIAGAGGRRTVPLDRFYLGYKQFDLAPDEIITHVRIPLPPAGDILRLYKVSRRRDLDISAFTAAIRLRAGNGTIDRARVAYGGVAPVVLRLTKTEEFLAGRTLDAMTFEEAGRIAASEVAPISDVRGSRDYRLRLAENILMKFYYEAVESRP